MELQVRRILQDHHDSFVPLSLEDVMQQIEQLLADQLSRNKGNAYLHVFVAQYVRSFRPSPIVEGAHLTAAEVNSQLSLSQV